MTSSALVSTPFGTALRRRRRARGASQLALAHRAQTTSRHLSFLETGRSRPSRDMVARLAEALDLPLREANELFRAAGLAPAYPETSLEAAELAPFSTVLELMLERHAPYPAFVIDRYWNIVRANRAAAVFLPDGADLGTANLVRLTYAGPWREMMANWGDIAWTGVRRLRAEAAAHPDDETLAELVSLAEDAARDAAVRLDVDGDRVLCPHFLIGDRLIRTITVLAQFGAAIDVTLEELRVELIYPADEEAATFFATLG